MELGDGIVRDEDLQQCDKNYGKKKEKAYEIVLNGTEIGGGSVRIHQGDIQEKMLEVLGFTKEVATLQFGFLLNAFKYGVPPHAGLAYGLDRLVMLMAGMDSIRDVIAFPKVKAASCMLCGAPDVVDDMQLVDLGLEIKVNNEDNQLVCECSLESMDGSCLGSDESMGMHIDET